MACGSIARALCRTQVRRHYLRTRFRSSLAAALPCDLIFLAVFGVRGGALGGEEEEGEWNATIGTTPHQIIDDGLEFGWTSEAPGLPAWIGLVRLLSLIHI